MLQRVNSCVFYSRTTRLLHLEDEYAEIICPIKDESRCKRE